MTHKRIEKSYRVKRANQVHRTIGPTVGYLRTLREQLDKSGLDYNDSFYRSVTNAYEELQKLFITSCLSDNYTAPANLSDEPVSVSDYRRVG